MTSAPVQNDATIAGAVRIKRQRTRDPQRLPLGTDTRAAIAQKNAAVQAATSIRRALDASTGFSLEQSIRNDTATV